MPPNDGGNGPLNPSENFDDENQRRDLTRRPDNSNLPRRFPANPNNRNRLQKSGYQYPSYPFYGLNPRRKMPVWAMRSRKPGQNGKNGKAKKSRLPLIATIVAGLFIAGLLGTVALAVGTVGAGISAAVAGYNYYAAGLSLDREYAIAFESTRILDRNGVLLYEKQPAEGARTYISIKDIPKNLINATIAAEDPTFFENQGVDPNAILRAIYINVTKRGSSGASTITQQVARLLYLPPEERVKNTLDRKIREAILATMISEKFTKQQILEKYLNQIYYGNLAYGIQAASLGYFGKEAKDLSLAEAAMLAGLPQLPSEYDPTINYDYARTRQQYVLDQMVKNGMISTDQAKEAFAYDIKSNLKDRRKTEIKIRAPHFVNYILQQMTSEVGPKQLSDAGVLISADEWNQGGYEITTSVDVRLVEEAEKVARKRVDDLKKQEASNAALVAIRPETGEILSMLGSVDYNSKEIDGQFNAAISQRQPGSSIKPITYAAALTKGWTAATVLADVPTVFPGSPPFKPNNFDGSTRGPVPLRNALGSSLNIVAVKALQFDGIDYMMDLAGQMGIKFQQTANFYGLPLTLGGGEVRLLDLTGAYGVFANQGNKVDPISILKITRRNQTVYEYSAAKVMPRQVLTPQNAYIITNILSDNEARLLAFARNNPLVLTRPAAAKTGTTNDFKDSWTVGYTPDLVVGVWVGNNNNKSMLAVAGSIGGGQIWHDYMEDLYSNPDLTAAIKPANKPLLNEFPEPPGIKKVTICTESGLLPNDKPEFDCPQKRTEIFAEGSVPKDKSTLHQKVKVPKVRPPEPPRPGVPNPGESPSPTPTPTPRPTRPPDIDQDIKLDDYSTYCVADDSYPPDMVEEKLFYNYPPELKAWGISKGRIPPPTQPCPTYVKPTPTPSPSPSPSPSPEFSTPVPIFTPPVPVVSPPGGGSTPLPNPGQPVTQPPALTPAPNRPQPPPTTARP